MRLVFINMHDNLFLLKNLENIIKLSKLKTFKHKYLLDMILENSDIEVVNYIVSEEQNNKGLPRYINCEKLRADFVFALNGIKLNSIKTVYDPDEIGKEDIIIAWYYFPQHMKILSTLNCYKVVMGQHFIKLNRYSELEKYNVNMFVNEVDLTNNDFVNKYFGLKNVSSVIMPFVFGKRFKKSVDIKKRKNTALAIGSLSTVKNGGYEEYMKFANTPWVQPMRGKILKNKQKLTKWIDCYISYIFENKTYKLNSNDMFVVRLYKKIWNYYNGWRQTKYLSFDMVGKFNEYKMFVCPEEYVGMPGIGFVEGMACGCAYIGLDHEMYKGLGLVPGTHYIGYDGTLKDLINKIEYYQANNIELEKIANAGYQYVTQYFNERTVAENFLNKLRDLGGEKCE